MNATLSSPEQINDSRTASHTGDATAPQIFVASAANQPMTLEVVDLVQRFDRAATPKVIRDFGINE